jgi:hypothetical protein
MQGIANLKAVGANNFDLVDCVINTVWFEGSVKLFFTFFQLHA